MTRSDGDDDLQPKDDTFGKFKKFLGIDDAANSKDVVDLTDSVEQLQIANLAANNGPGPLGGGDPVGEDGPYY